MKPHLPGHVHDARGEGARRLLWAVLIDAIEVYRSCRPGAGGAPGSPRRPSRQLQRERRWLESNDTTSPFTFVSVCEALGLDPGYIRRLVLRSSGKGPAKRTQRKLEARVVRLVETGIRMGGAVPTGSGDGGDA